MKKILVFFLFLIIPICIVSADTWLDDPSYRDTSWFDPDAYASTSLYTIDSSSKVAGLLYLVNEGGYTFENKKIKLIGDTHTSYCQNSGNCIIDMSAHDWVPLKSYFKGKYEGNNNTRIYIETDEDELHFIEDISCYDIYDYENYEICNFPFAGFKTIIDINDGGTINRLGGLREKTASGETVYYEIKPNNDYYIYSIEVKDTKDKKIKIYDKDTDMIYHNNDNIDGNELYNFNNMIFKFYMPNSPATIKVVFKKRDEKKCVVIKGNGKKIGSEIKCESEHFYTIGSDNEDIKMISKYNLYSGYNVYKEKITKDNEDTRTDEQYCNDLASSKNGFVKTEGIYTDVGYCYYAVPINNGNFVKQNENAISAHWDSDGNYSFPFVGDVYLTGDSNEILNSSSSINYDFYIDEESGSKYDNYFYDLRLGNNNVYNILMTYKNTLRTYGIDIKDINLITLDEINKVIQSNNKNIPYAEWRESTRTAIPPHYEFAFLNDYLTKEQDFIYNTTYWVRTGYERTNSYLGVNSVIFVNSAGGVCGGKVDYEYHDICGFLFTSSINTQMAAGVRPVITIPYDALLYGIKTEVVGKGNIETVDYANGNDKITFKVSNIPNNKLETIVITTSNGEIINYNEENLTYNEDDTISISTNKFTMPYDSVTIKAVFITTDNIITKVIDKHIVNPNTGDKIISLVFLFIMSSLLILIINKKKRIALKEYKGNL